MRDLSIAEGFTVMNRTKCVLKQDETMECKNSNGQIVLEN